MFSGASNGQFVKQLEEGGTELFQEIAGFLLAAALCPSGKGVLGG